MLKIKDIAFKPNMCQMVLAFKNYYIGGSFQDSAENNDKSARDLSNALHGMTRPDEKVEMEAESREILSRYDSDRITRNTLFLVILRECGDCHGVCSRCKKKTVVKTAGHFKKFLKAKKAGPLMLKSAARADKPR